MGNPVGWFEIYVDDMARARQFYETVLGVTLAPLDSGGPQMLAFPAAMDQYGAGGALVHMDGFGAGGNSTLVYFSCKDCAVEAGRVEAAEHGEEAGRAHDHRRAVQPRPVEQPALQAGKARPQAEQQHQHADAHHDAEEIGRAHV